ncbi:hypothetical protein [Bradyrhizobium sp. 2S1]|uniref:hypothetical protein n=1 Tax=Bradyrhizobium sp. 2S1 TaxID=1404429 RepID=UPI00140DC2A1|nr:hypothetical protein [Bradyrhizobium sp. 2S1]MCK7670843.1 hypothetical protein [Bradyrhizobium sp. 2S1]
MEHPLQREWNNLTVQTGANITRLMEIQKEIIKDDAFYKPVKKIIEEIDLLGAALIIQDAENCSMFGPD